MTATNWTYARVTRGWPCGGCGKCDWCRHLLRDGEPWADLCNRVATDRLAKGDGGGWLHVVGDGGGYATTGRIANVVTTSTDRASSALLSFTELTLIVRQCRAGLSPGRLATLADRLCVSAAALAAMGVGYSAERWAFTVPMFDADGRIVGLRTRFADGTKRCWPGSRLGLILPAGVRAVLTGEAADDADAAVDVLLVCEGESDAAAAIDLGYTAVGRPGCGACGGVVLDVIRRLRPARPVLLADADTPGQNGAHALARRLVQSGIGCRVLTLPDGHKDLRVFKASTDYATHHLAALIDAPADNKDCS